MRKWLVSKDRKPITWNNIKNYFLALYRYYFTEEWKDNQAEFRKYKIELLSPECISKGYCIHCKCSFPEKLYEDQGCELGCYLKWMNKKEWFKFKETKEYARYIKDNKLG